MMTGWFLFEHARAFGFSHPDLLGDPVWPDARPSARTDRSTSQVDTRSQFNSPQAPVFLASDQVFASPSPPKRSVKDEDSLELELPD